ncbi:SDR family NAD(P)-dependent oxidoreductase [Glycomyces xiaoerkulensis]|uniref:SDR family NAD(P)-dependent oxidoreductase n=1 Tax=Glycomyces xiaoerkulensis TaxID=2038139 RepID=UPI0018E46362|nr:SDR family NAD(P)-dependent oxidoreductase [Glycomyces xiaoerkulensis]
MRTIVMTGGTSGFGAITADRLRSAGTRLILAARRPTAPAESIPLDLAELDSVRAFADTLGDRLDPAGIDALVCNAGGIRADAAGRTADGYETTFAVNHLAHYLLLRLLLPALADRATVVVTTSGTHDPATKAGLALPRHAEADLLARPDRDPGLHTDAREAGQHAYTASKLCVLLTARALAARPEARERRLSVIAYCPGQVFGTGLVGDLPLPMRIAWSVLGTPLGWPLRRFNRFLNTREAAADGLADLALGTEPVPDGEVYAALRRGRITWPEPSARARDDQAAEALWRDSATLAGLPD